MIIRGSWDLRKNIGSKLRKVHQIKSFNNRPKPIIISTFWMTFSSSYSLLIIWPILLFLPFLPDQKKQKGFFYGWLAMNIIWAGLITLITVIAFQIPIIAKNPTYNYWLNFVIHSLFLWLLFYLTRNKK